MDRQSREVTLDTVVSNNRDSTKAFLAEMKKAGYEDIYFVTFPIEGISTREMRYQGFKEEVSADPEKLLVLGQDGTAQKILQLIEQRQEKIAFFTMNGPALLDFMKILNKTDYSYPRDFGLGSYEDLEWMEVLNPNVSCIRQDSYKIGQVAAEHLIKKLRGELAAEPAQLLVVPSFTVLRSSF